MYEPMHMGACVCGYLSTCVHMYVETEVDVRHLPQLLLTLFFERGFLTEPGTQIDWSIVMGALGDKGCAKSAVTYHPGWFLM